MAQVYKRALRGEAEWLPEDLADVIAIRRTLLESGLPSETVAGIMAWLVVKSAGERDTTSEPTRARYRRILAGLDSPVSNAIPRSINSPLGTPQAA